MASPEFPEWTGADPASSAWDTVVLGGVQLPGICTIDGLECAVDVDTKKAKGAERPTSTDNGVKPAKFEIDQWINAKQWPATQLAIAQINPRRLRVERKPVQCVNPLVNVAGITNVRIISFAPKHPTARGGMHIRWKIEEWFDKPVAVKKSKTQPQPIPAIPQHSNALSLDDARVAALQDTRIGALHDMSAEDLDPNTGLPLSPTDPKNVQQTMLLGNPNNGSEGSGSR
jgi:hypothetical protein